MPLEPKQRAKKLDYTKADIYLLATNPYEEWRGDACAKEPGTVKWLEESVQPGDAIYDVGACIGAYSFIAAYLLGDSGGCVYAIEPAASNFAALAVNTMLNAQTRKVYPLAVALSDCNRVLHLEHSDVMSGAATHSLASDPAAFSHPVLAWSLDTLRSVYKLQRPNLIKIDVDGHEYTALKGMKNTLKDSKLRSVLVEVNEGLTFWERIEPLMKSCGLALKEKQATPSSGAPGIAPLHNWLFVREKKVLDDEKPPEAPSGRYADVQGVARIEVR